MRTLVISSRPSRSATALARALGIRKLATTGRVITRPTRLLNWGCSWRRYSERYINRGSGDVIRLLNNPDNVAVATNKLLTFQRLAEDPEIPIPEFTVNETVANSWLAGGTDIMLRQQLTGHSGAGIVFYNHALYSQGEEPHVATAPLYVKYMKKKHEYRVHVVGDNTDVQQKRKRQETPNEEVDYQVRNHANGWVYCREELSIPQGMEALAQRVVQQLGLDFGAVDIIWNQKSNQMTVLECNTAPGLEGQTLEFYARHLGELVGSPSNTNQQEN